MRRDEAEGQDENGDEYAGDIEFYGAEGRNGYWWSDEDEGRDAEKKC